MAKRVRLGRIYREARPKESWNLSEIRYVYDTPLSRIKPEYKELKIALEESNLRIADQEKKRVLPKSFDDPYDYNPYEFVERAKETVIRNAKLSDAAMRTRFDI